MKKKIFIGLGGLLLLIFLVVATYAWYLFFLKVGLDYNSTYDVSHLKPGDIYFRDDGKGVVNLDAKSLDDASIDEVPAYYFKVINTKTASTDYTLYIEDIPESDESKLLPRGELKYQLLLNGKVIKEDYMDKIVDNILDTRTIDSNTVNEYSLKVYIRADAIDWVGKHYYYKITMNG